MRFRTLVEPPEPMRGLEVPPEVVEALGGGARPPVTTTINWPADWRDLLRAPPAPTAERHVHPTE